MAQPSVRKSILIKASPEKVFAFLVDPKRQVGLLPGLMEVTRAQLPFVVGSTFHFKYMMFGFLFPGVWTVTKLEAPYIYEGMSSGIVSYWRYSLTPVAEGAYTNLVLEVSYDPPTTVLSKLGLSVLEKLNDEAGDQFLQNTRVILEQNRDYAVSL